MAGFNEAHLAPYLALSFAPEPDLFIRTGGEQRVSNFCLWHLAYTELYFTEILWPDFDEAAFAEALASYSPASDASAGPAKQLAQPRQAALFQPGPAEPG